MTIRGLQRRGSIVVVRYASILTRGDSRYVSRALRPSASQNQAGPRPPSAPVPSTGSADNAATKSRPTASCPVVCCLLSPLPQSYVSIVH